MTLEKFIPHSKVIISYPLKVENFAPLNFLPNVIIPIKFSVKIFVPLKIFSKRVSGVKKDRPLKE